MARRISAALSGRRLHIRGRQYQSHADAHVQHRHRKRPFGRRRVLGRLGRRNSTTGRELRLRAALLTIVGLDGLQSCRRVARLGRPRANCKEWPPASLALSKLNGGAALRFLTSCAVGRCVDWRFSTVLRIMGSLQVSHRSMCRLLSSSTRKPCQQSTDTGKKPAGTLFEGGPAGGWFSWVTLRRRPSRSVVGHRPDSA